MHPRRAILDAIRTELEGAGGFGFIVYEQDETSRVAPCWQIMEEAERLGEQTVRGHYQRQLAFAVTAWGTTPPERDSMSEALEAALLGVAVAGSFELEWTEVDLRRPAEHVGERLYPATYRLVATYFSSR